MVDIIKEVAGYIKKYPSPISEVTRLAQFVLETGAGTSELFKNANNCFGIKYSVPFTGVGYNHLTKEEVNGNIIKTNDVFRKYASIEESVKDHAGFFTSTDFRKNYYKEAIEATNYIDECNALAKKYATDSNYGSKLIKTISTYNLHQYFNTPVNTTNRFTKPKMTDRRKIALGYPSSGYYKKRTKAAIKNIVWHYSATLRMGNAMENIKAHEGYWKSTHGWDIGGYHYYIDRYGAIVWNYDLEIVTYGAKEANPYSVHICCEASSANNYTEAQIASREKLTLWLMQELNLPGAAVKGHYEMPGNSTSCPGYSLTQLAAFRNNLQIKYNKGISNNGHNPQGLMEINTSDYQPPLLPFKTFKVGDVVTLEKDWLWFNPSKDTQMKSKRQSELTGTKDKIVTIEEVPAGSNSSRYAYKLEKYNSWILEEHLVESKENWKTIEDKEITKEGILELNGIKYRVIPEN